MCPHEEQLTAWLLGDLPPEEHQALTRHLETCASCRSVREELASVLTPLRSGLEKDRHLRIAPQPLKAAPRRNRFRSLWSAPHEGLRRAAILTLSFGTLFALLSAVYQSAQRKPHDATAVTHLTFLRSDEAPVPALAPVEAMGRAVAAKDTLVEATLNPEPLTATAPVAMPATPAPERPAPVFRKLAATAPAPAAAPAPSYPPEAVAKRERSKPARASSPLRPPADLITKPVRLAGMPPPALVAPTNTVPTNAVPTNAVMPTAKAKP